MILVLMGVSGCGKTTVGTILGNQLGWEFNDADDFHPPSNVAKMRAGHALTDKDRWPWLDRLNALLRASELNGKDTILACSALRQVYRDRLAQGCKDVRWFFLKGTFELIQSRLTARKGHYMNPALLQSQFATLEEPANATVIDIAPAPEILAAQIRKTIEG
jgi:gluconokinase